ncbi:MAG: GNAT family N-acetyltransferase [Coriobacteriia bacterium]|nr:GNAT family N-acetyltransferase [Coriobacteriia bacterium]MCL2605825.1 GNAT family N-acetyltransferase [Coriobacteriia bacterium]
MLETKKITRGFVDQDLILHDLTNQFPREQHVPYAILMRRVEQGYADFLAFYDGSKYVGLAYCIVRADIMYVLFLAVSEAVHSKGYGGQIIDTLKACYQGKKIVLNIEEPNESAPNAQQRVRRKIFYERHGFKVADFRVIESGAIYEVMVYRGTCTPIEYKTMLRILKGPVLSIFIKSKILNASETT